LPEQNFISKSNLWVKTRAEHGTCVTKEAQTLLSKKDKKLYKSYFSRIEKSIFLIAGNSADSGA
jgi:hypothetical protein